MRENSPCIEHVEGNHYRCKNHGFDIHTDVLPIFCGPCNDIAPDRDVEVRQSPQGKVSPLFGDRIAALTRAVGIKPCGGCKKRQKRLNAMHAAIKRLFRKKDSKP